MNAGDIIPLQFQPSLVAISFFVAVLGSYFALVCAGRIRESDVVRKEWILGAAVALGGVGIWSMHFIGMTAQVMPFRVTYDLATTVASLVAAIAVSYAAFWFVGRRAFNLTDLLIGGSLAGIGVAVMHYLGMAAVMTQARLDWDVRIVAASVAIAIVAANVALWLAFNLKRRMHRMIAAIVMGVAVCGMHYTGMVAGTIICTAKPVPPSAWALSGADLPYYVAILALGAVMFIWIQIAASAISTGTARAAAERR